MMPKSKYSKTEVKRILTDCQFDPNGNVAKIILEATPDYPLDKAIHQLRALDRGMSYSEFVNEVSLVIELLVMGILRRKNG